MGGTRAGAGTRHLYLRIREGAPPETEVYRRSSSTEKWRPAAHRPRPHTPRPSHPVCGARGTSRTIYQRDQNLAHMKKTNPSGKKHCAKHFKTSDDPTPALYLGRTPSAHCQISTGLTADTRIVIAHW